MSTLGKALLLAAAGMLLPPQATAAPEVAVTTGKLRGTNDGAIRVFKGIPYAAPPLGERRWRPPAPPLRWNGIRDASAYGFSCPQVAYPGDSAPVETPGNEDCLTLNIWTGGAGDRQRPVMLWIHGGGFMNGGSATAVTDGAALARQGVTVVTINYRLGRLGFFAHPALSAESPRAPLGNYGLMDQIAALRWVQANIAAFGGDPRNVTLFGESAGGGSVAALMTSPLAKGLFAKAIIQSGGGRQIPIPIRGKALDGGPSMEEVGTTFARGAGISGDVLKGLRSLDAATVIGGINMLNNNDRARTVNWSVDGVLLAADPTTIFARGGQARVPMMIGATSDELGALPMIGAITTYTLAQFGDAATRLRILYKRADGTDEINRLPSDAFFVEPSRFMALQAAKGGQRVFHYSFGYIAETLRSGLKGARHASDVPYVFNNPDTIPGVTDTDRAMARAISAAWVRFARAGNPARSDWPWPPYDLHTRRTLAIEATGPRTVLDIDRARLDAIEAAYQQKIWSKLIP
ncbi:carboxylesterase/lipase family protein [Sphingomonas koreensis]